MKKKITEKIDKVVMSRMAVSPGRLYGDSGGGILGFCPSKSFWSAAAYGSSVLYSSGEFGNFKEPIIGVEGSLAAFCINPTRQQYFQVYDVRSCAGDFSCTLEVQ
ncbi:hypothetical protein WN944_007831 [Citrus x changshan-huyou]|uniref:Uncharacterized protein n=1 Tax=Citrus x changshan-huyou TaxID=2935761 RepID=A0AAP0MRV0_9ROSI